MSHINNNKINKGFGIIEVLISAFMIATMLGGAVILGNTSMQKVNYAQSKLVAYNLANQAIEEVVAIRNYAYNDDKPETGFNNSSTTSASYGEAGLPGTGNYTLDVTNDFFIAKLNQDNTGIGQPIYYLKDNSITYNSTTSPVAITYTRKIKIDDIKKTDSSSSFNMPYNTLDGNNNPVLAKKITVTVSWVQEGMVNTNGQVTQTLVLTDWKNGINTQ